MGPFVTGHSDDASIHADFAKGMARGTTVFLHL